MEQQKLDKTRKEGIKPSLNEFLDHLLIYSSEAKNTQKNIPKNVEKENNEKNNYPILNIKSDINKENGKYIIYLFNNS